MADRLIQLATETDRIEGYDQPHATALARLTQVLASEFEMYGPDLTALLFAALGHDLGVRKWKRAYLLRNGPLSWEETLDLWRHPILGEQQAAELHLPRHTQLLIRWHHEWWNGQGYPDGLAESAIPLGARILRVADTYCALTASRPYREAFDPLEAEQIVADQAGIEFDPLVVEVLLAYLQEERERRAAEMIEQTGLPEDALEIGFAEEPGLAPPLLLPVFSNTTRSKTNVPETGEPEPPVADSGHSPGEVDEEAPDDPLDLAPPLVPTPSEEANPGEELALLEDLPEETPTVAYQGKKEEEER
ncbi:MAG: HD domain-containing phosphohydrolase [Blastocatellia bacterium]|jgi:hypothetical protein